MELALAYKSLIDAILARTGSASLMHVHVGMAIYLLTLLLVRHRRGMVVALIAVFAAEMANETMDWLAASPRWTWHDTLSDIALTMLWPVATTLVMHYRRRRWRRTVATATRRGAARFRRHQPPDPPSQSPCGLPDAPCSG